MKNAEQACYIRLGCNRYDKALFSKKYVYGSSLLASAH